MYSVCFVVKKSVSVFSTLRLQFFCVFWIFRGHTSDRPIPAVASRQKIRTVPSMSTLLSRITVEAGKCGGRPCIRGYRLRVKDVLELLAHGASWEEILTDYPFLEADDLRACLEFAAAQNDHVLLHAS